MISSNEINKNDVITFKVEDVQEFSDGTKAYKLGDFYVSGDTLNKMNVTSVTSCASIEIEEAINTYSPFDRTGRGDEYYFIDTDGEVEAFQETGAPEDEILREVANYCTDKKLISQRAMHETLNRLLWRYSEEHGGDNEWVLNSADYGYQKHWYIYFSHISKKFCWTYNDTHKTAGTIYFRTDKAAQKAIKDVIEPFIEKHPDFAW